MENKMNIIKLLVITLFLAFACTPEYFVPEETGPAILATSGAPELAEVGSHYFILNENGVKFAVGDRVLVTSRSDPDVWMSGFIITYAAGCLTVLVDSVGDRETESDWDITVI
jgi:hypothetical protein